jgi:hypothetical protein
MSPGAVGAEEERTHDEHGHDLDLVVVARREGAEVAIHCNDPLEVAGEGADVPVQPRPEVASRCRITTDSVFWRTSGG